MIKFNIEWSASNPQHKDVNDVQVSSNGDWFDLTVTVIDTFAPNTTVVATDWSVSASINSQFFDVGIVGISDNKATVTVNSYENYSFTEKVCEFTISCKIDGIKYRQPFAFTIVKNLDKTVLPIWEDVEYKYYDGDSLTYRIYYNDEVIYNGKSIKKPDEYNVHFNINKICADYLNSGKLEFLLYFTQSYADEYTGIFTIKQVIDANTTNEKEIWLEDYKFYNNYSYVQDKQTDTPFNSIPIKRKEDQFVMYGRTIDRVKVVADKRQYQLLSAYNTFNGYQKQIQRYMNNFSNFGTKSYRIDNNEMLVASVNYTDLMNQNQSSTDITSVDFVAFNLYNNGFAFSIEFKETCYDYCLYYKNGKGGWDSYLIRGNALKTDNINSSYYKKYVKNTDEFGFGKTKMSNVINTKYNLYTDYLTDDEQERFYNLIESTEVYLHNLNTDEILPVNITNNNFDYKTFTNNGKKKWYNTIECEVAKEKIIK